MAEQGGFLSAPAVYMDKIAVGPNLPPGVVDLDETPGTNLRNLAKATDTEVSDLLICILDRPRHEDLIAKVREAGARVMLISDGDVSGVIATAQPHSNVDMYLGVGGAPEGVLAAAALACVGGQMQGRLLLRSEDERARARRRGITDLTRKYELKDMAQGDIMFAATGITDGTLLQGVHRFKGGATTHSIVIRAKSGTLRSIEARHRLDHFGDVFGE
jgi:fructose-1,6-bisphosphatase II / sedoheptulose-1,7-bisphosphatase